MTLLVGSSGEGVQQAIGNAISRARQTIQQRDWVKVREIRGNIQGDSIKWYQARLGLGLV